MKSIFVEFFFPFKSVIVIALKWQLSFFLAFLSVQRIWCKLPAILALMKQIIEPETKARIDTDVIILRFSGHIVPRFPIIIPSELKLANPQIANVVIATLRG